MKSRWIIWASLLTVLAIFAAHLADKPIARFMADINPHLFKLFTFITWFGQGGVILYPSGVIFLLAIVLKPLLPSLAVPLERIMTRAALIFITVAGAGVVDDALKIIFGRARPRQWLSGDMSGFHFFRYGAKFASFPSGHTATSMAAAVIFSALFPRFRWIFASFALLIAISRIMVDAHYLSDVLGGAAVGGAVACLIQIELRKRKLLGLPHSRIQL